LCSNCGDNWAKSVEDCFRKEYELKGQSRKELGQIEKARYWTCFGSVRKCKPRRKGKPLKLCSNCGDNWAKSVEDCFRKEYELKGQSRKELVVNYTKYVLTVQCCFIAD
uniref:Zf-3CxxC domain-containing protein n=1 Tax=Gongylonema pulchrum TaxID=637853 RepID=A0A183EWT3_9BILA